MPGGMLGGFPGGRAPISGGASSGPTMKRVKSVQVEMEHEGPKFSKFHGSFKVRVATISFYILLILDHVTGRNNITLYKHCILSGNVTP